MQKELDILKWESKWKFIQMKQNGDVEKQSDLSAVWMAAQWKHCTEPEACFWFWRSSNTTHDNWQIADQK